MAGNVVVHRPFRRSMGEHRHVPPQVLVRGYEVIVGDDVDPQMADRADGAGA